MQELADHIASGKLVGYINQWLFHDDALRAERDEYKRKYELVITDSAYGECCEVRAKAEAERDALKEQVELKDKIITSCVHDRCELERAMEKFGMEFTDDYGGLNVEEVITTYIADLTRKLEEAKKLGEGWKKQYEFCHVLHLEAQAECEEKNVFMLTLRAVTAEAKLEAIQNTVGEENWSLREKLAEAQNEICTASDQIPPDLDGDSLSVALIKLKDKLAASEQAVTRAQQQLETWELGSRGFP